MKRLLYTTILAVIWLGLGAFVSASHSTKKNIWVLHNETSDLRVFVKDAAHSNLKELKIEMWFRQTDISDIMGVLGNGSGYTDWLYKCMHAENVKRLSSLEKIDYFQLDFPWPLNDRDIYNHSRISYDADTHMVTIESDPAVDFPEKDNFVRIRKNRTRWYFHLKPSGDVFLEYYAAPNPGGSIPDWLVNLVIDKGPTKTMLRFRELVEAQKGTHPSLDWLK